MSVFYADIETTRGPVVVELFDRDCPDTVETFARLANEGFYDGTPVASVAPGRFAEAGAATPTPVPTEALGNRNRPEPGALVVGQVGAQSDLSRVLFVTGDAAREALAGTHTVFGMTEDGMDVVASLQPGDVLQRVRVRS